MFNSDIISFPNLGFNQNKSNMSPNSQCEYHVLIDIGQVTAKSWPVWGSAGEAFVWWGEAMEIVFTYIISRASTGPIQISTASFLLEKLFSEVVGLNRVLMNQQSPGTSIKDQKNHRSWGPFPYRDAFLFPFHAARPNQYGSRGPSRINHVSLITRHAWKILHPHSSWKDSLFSGRTPPILNDSLLYLTQSPSSSRSVLVHTHIVTRNTIYLQG